MATISRASGPRSGGKIVRNRLTTAAKTPYDRPRLPPPVPENPSWLSTATRMVAAGAGKFLNSVFGPDSSSSSSSSGSDTSSDDEVDNDNDHDEICSQGVDRLHKNGTSSKMVQCFRKEPQSTEGKNETKHVIEKLLVQETFSREECERLIKIIKSRVVDCPIIKDGQDGGLSEIPNRTVGSAAQMTDLCSTAVMEAKKWLEEKKLGSSSKSQLDHGTCSLNSVMLPQVTDGEAGSPVDMAKSYMRARPLWASPSMNHIEFKTPSPVQIQPFKEEALYSVGGNSLSSSKLERDSLTTGSWNILEEIRRVRAKATEDMLGTLSSTKIHSSIFALEHKTSPNSSVPDHIEVAMEDKLQDSDCLTATGATTTCGIPVSEMTQDRLQNEVLSSSPAIFVSEQNQDLEAGWSIEGKGGAASKSEPCTIPDFGSKQSVWDGLEDILSSRQQLNSSDDMKTALQSNAGDVDGLKDTNGSNQHPSSTIGGIVQDSRSNERNCSSSKEATDLRDAYTANGFPPESGLSPGMDIEPKPGPSNEKCPDPIGSSHNKITSSVAGEETCELLSEASIEVPVVNEADGIASGSHNSSSMRYEELSQNPTKTKSKRSLAATRGVVEKQQERKLSRYNRKGRGRGK